MSIETCDYCENKVDTDYDCDAYVENSSGDILVMCSDCRRDTFWNTYREYEAEQL